MDMRKAQQAVQHHEFVKGALASGMQADSGLECSPARV